jgi:hypothetical protein
LIGILTNSGGISNEFTRIASLVKKETGSIMVTDDNPEKLVDRALEEYLRLDLPSSVVFDRG